MGKIKRLHLLLSAMLLAVCTAVTLGLGQTVPAWDYATKLDAATRMQTCMNQVRAYKEELGIAISPDDLHKTGMIGQPYTGITTTNGALEAKRTTANSDMAALMVQLLTEAGVRPGDTVGAGFSGSFPAMNLAVLSACAVMDVNVVYIASVGASTYGANEPQLTFPEMVSRLVDDGILPQNGVAVSMGGQSDCGLDMDPELRQSILNRLKEDTVPILMEEDYARNIYTRRTLYEQSGPITCFIGVGGNLTTSGRGENELSWGVIPPDTVKNIDEKSGLMEIYNAKGIPVIHLLNIKRLVADYGLPYDPERLPKPGESAIYYKSNYPKWPAAVGLAGTALLLWTGRKKEEME